MTRARIAVFGAGLIGARHIDQVARHARLAAIVDPAPASRELAARHGVACHADHRAYLDTERPDGAIIATPNHLHHEHALACIAAGIPVLIEKPMADTLANADTIVSAARERGVPVLVGHHRRHNPIIERAKAEIDAGTLGEITAVQGQFWLYKPDDYFAATWRKGAGAGPTLINFIHDIDLLRHLCGDVVEVQAMRSNRRRGHEVEDTAAILLRFANGALGTFSISDTVAAPWSWEMTSGENPIYPHRPGHCYMIGGTHGALSVPDLQVWQHEGPRSWWNPIGVRTLDVVHADAFERQFAHFLDMLAGAPPRVSASEGRDSLAATLGVLNAALPQSEFGP